MEASAMMASMSDVDVTARQERVVGRPFLPGQSGNPAGRPRGSRNRLAESFVEDLRDCWQQHGMSALNRVARDDPATLLKVIASLMPKDLNLNVGVNVEQFAMSFRSAQAMLGNEAPPPRRRLRNQPVIIDGS
jgi:hypothetical protein